MKRPSSWDAATVSPWMIKIPFPGAKALMTLCVRAGLFFSFSFQTLKRCNSDLFNILYSDKIQNCAEDCFSEAVSQSNLGSTLLG